MTAAGGMNNAIPDDIRDDTHGGPGPIGLANTPWPAHPKVERIARRPVCKKAGLGYTLESGHPGATDAAPEAPCSSQGQALGPRFRGGDGKEKIEPICLVRTTSCFQDEVSA